MDALTSAMQGAASAPRSAPQARAPLLLVGGGGALGSVLLAELLARAGQGRVAALVDDRIQSAVRNFVPLPRRRLHEAGGIEAGTAVLVFERERHSNGRDDAFVQPQPEELLPLAQALARHGVQQLIVVVPHAPALLPGALKHGFASSDEAALAQLPFEQLLILRSAQSLASAGEQRGMAAFAHWWMSQLRWMIPQQQQPVRALRLAALVAELALLLPEAPPGHRVLPPELLWQAAQAADARPVLRAWLEGGRASG